jgi:hypothetical protein
MMDKVDVENASALSKLKAIRDKQIAHNEILSTKAIHGPTWKEIDDLLKRAHELLSVISFRLINYAFKDSEGRYFLDDDAKRTQRAINRMFRELFATGRKGSRAE